MLVITRRYGKQTVIRCGEHEITLSVREFHGNQVKLCIEAPEPVDVLREELAEAVIENPGRRGKYARVNRDPSGLRGHDIKG